MKNVKRKRNRVYAVIIHLILFTQLSNFSLQAQAKYTEKYDWSVSPSLHTLSEADQGLEEIILKEKLVMEFVFDKNLQLHEYVLYHKITRVNSGNAIESNNRIYLTEDESSKILVQKARVIKKDGSVKLLKKENIIEAVDEETKNKYKYFALEGLEKGCEIEYLYKMEIAPFYTGTNKIFQSNISKRNMEFTILCPRNLFFATKSLNGLPEMVLDTTNDGDNILSLTIDSIQALESEEFAVYKPNLMQVLYKLDKNTYASKYNIVNFKTISQGIYEMVYSNRTKTGTKALQSFFKGAKLDFARDETDKIRKIENFLKATVFVTEQSADELSDIETITKTNTASHTGIVMLYAGIFDMNKIDYQIVLTCDREELKFDKEFEIYNFLDDYLFYFPGLDLYLSPTLPFYRLGYIPYGYTNNYGLFIKRITVGDFTTGVGEVKFIEPLPYNKNTQNIYVQVQFTEDVSNPKITLTQEYNGLYAQYFQPYYDYIPADRKEDFNKSLIQNSLGETKIIKMETKNIHADDFGVRPFIVTAEVEGDLFVENAGEVLLFKIGELIGPQTELYQEEERKLEIENDFNRIYHREIRFNIPEAYEAKNLDALNFNVYPAEEDSTVHSMAFISRYEVSGNEVTVSIEEYYKEIIYPLEMYESFRNVINAAADFNKIVIVLQPVK